MSLAIAMGGCSSPAERTDVLADSLGLVREEIEGTRFRHVVYRDPKPGVGDMPLHVYLDGDGSPWRTRYRISSDPTPRRPIALKLMGRDVGRRIYIGRPCYNGEADALECRPELWTSRRYGPEVVDSMEAALRAYLRTPGNQDLVFIGYSGGGTLAMLLAERFPQTVGVVTVAGNLDPAGWAAHHGYSPLHGSLNPATRGALRPDIAQVHFVGSEDRVVPAALSSAFVRRQRYARIEILNGFDHVCCWEDAWPELLGRARELWDRKEP